jgi:hypothetical protein
MNYENHLPFWNNKGQITFNLDKMEEMSFNRNPEKNEYSYQNTGLQGEKESKVTYKLRDTLLIVTGSLIGMTTPYGIITICTCWGLAGAEMGIIQFFNR